MSSVSFPMHHIEGPRLLSDRVYEQLKALILGDQLHPGESLGEERLATQLAISRTPLRAALTRLEREGLVRTIAHKGCIVTEIRPADVRDVFEVREALEVSAVQMAAPLVNEAELEKTARSFAAIEEELARGEYNLYIPSDARFHALIMAHVSNHLLLDMLGRIYDQITRIRNFSHNSLGTHMFEAHREHTRILEAMRRRDPDAAGLAMRDHLRSVTQRAITLLDESRLGERPRDE